MLRTCCQRQRTWHILQFTLYWWWARLLPFRISQTANSGEDPLLGDADGTQVGRLATFNYCHSGCFFAPFPGQPCGGQLGKTSELSNVSLILVCVKKFSNNWGKSSIPHVTEVCTRYLEHLCGMTTYCENMSTCGRDVPLTLLKL